MAKKKEGFTNRFEENALLESALIVSEKSEGMFSDLVPYRIDKNTVILIDPNQNKEDQAQLFLAKLECNRIRYY